MVMHDVEIAEAGVYRAQERMNQRFQILGPNGGQPDNSHAAVLASFRREVISAIRGYLVAHFRKRSAGFFVAGFDATVFANHASAADECNAQPRRFTRTSFGT